MEVNFINQATKVILERYVQILEESPYLCTTDYDSEYLLEMCRTAIYHYKVWPTDKLSRWLGFIQGVMVMQGVLNVEEERDFTRPLFHQAYKFQGILIPDSVTVKKEG